MAVDKLVDSTQLNADLTSVANAIRTKGGTSAQMAFPAGFVSAVEAIPTGGGGEEAPFNDVNFYDYDGKIVASYTKAEFLALDALPSNPSHSGLVAQGWNWTLAGAKSYVTKYGFLDIGQSYITSDGATRVKIAVYQDYEQPFKLYWTQNKANGVTIDWGDGSPTETASGSGTGGQNKSHTYTGKGIYTISMMPDDDCDFWLGNRGNLAIWGAGNAGYGFSTKIIGVNIGKNYPELGGGPVFGSCYACNEVTIPRSCTTLNSVIGDALSANGVVIIPYGVTEISVNSFCGPRGKKAICIPETLQDITGATFAYNQLNINRVCIPDAQTSIPQSMFTNMHVLQQVAIPSGITSIGSSAFANAYSLNSFIVPAGVTSIGATAFQFFRGSEIVMLPTVPPTIESSTFSNLLSETIIYVPYSADHSVLNAYTSATNWSALASRIQEMSA